MGPGLPALGRQAPLVEAVTVRPVPRDPGLGLGPSAARPALAAERAAKAKAPHVRDMGCFAAFVIVP